MITAVEVPTDSVATCEALKTDVADSCGSDEELGVEEAVAADVDATVAGRDVAGAEEVLVPESETADSSADGGIANVSVISISSGDTEELPDSSSAATR